MQGGRNFGGAGRFSPHSPRVYALFVDLHRSRRWRVESITCSTRKGALALQCAAERMVVLFRELLSPLLRVSLALARRAVPCVR